MIQKNKKTMIKEKGKEICQRVLDTNLEKRQFEIYLKISDNGIGCTEIKEGFGTRHMKERVEMLNGTVNFANKDGFVVEAVVPIRWGKEYD